MALSSRNDLQGPSTFTWTNGVTSVGSPHAVDEVQIKVPPDLEPRSNRGWREQNQEPQEWWKE